MKRTVTIWIVSVLIMLPFSLKAQDCTYYFPYQEGTEIELTSYDKKDKVMSITRQKVLNVHDTNDGKKLTILSTMSDKKGEEYFEVEMEAECRDGNFYFSMENFMNNPGLAAYETMDVEVTADDLKIPAKLKPGDVLPGGEVTATVSNAGMKMMTFSVEVSDRNVEGIEDITTPAGTFECYKIAYNVTSKFVVTVQTKAVEWFAEGVGIVKSESYNKNGKLASYSLLTKLKK